MVMARCGKSPANSRSCSRYPSAASSDSCTTSSRSRAATEDSLYTLWRADPGHFLWIEVAVVNYSFLSRKDVYKELRVAAAGDDPEAPVAKFLWARRMWHRRTAEAATAFWQADSLAAELNPLQRLWLQQRLARVESNGGDHDAGIRRLTRQLDAVWRLGGPIFAAKFWYDIAEFSLRRRYLDDASAAARNATACARRSGNGYVEAMALILAGRTHDARCEYDLAEESFRACESRSSEQNYYRWHREATGRRFLLAMARGNLDQQIALAHQTRHLADAVADTNGMIRSSAALAVTFGQAAEMDSARLHLQEAASLNASWTAGRLDDIVRATRLRVYMYEGRWAVAESLLTEALVGEEAALGAKQVDLIREAMESQRVDLAVHGFAAVENLSAEMFPQYGGQDPSWDLLLIGARLKARQGEFADARDRLERAAEHPTARARQDLAWQVHHARGEIAELARDHAAAGESYATCLELARAMGDPSLQHRSRVLLGYSLIRRDQTTAARELFASSLQTDLYWARLAAALFTGIAWSRDGEPEKAALHFAAADSMLGPAARNRRGALPAPGEIRQGHRGQSPGSRDRPHGAAGPGPRDRGIDRDALLGSPASGGGRLPRRRRSRFRGRADLGYWGRRDDPARERPSDGRLPVGP